jgi:hypothetical protein
VSVRFKRRRIWVDPPFQGRLMAHAGFYLLLYSLTLWHIGFLFEALRVMLMQRAVRGFGPLYMEYLGKQWPLLLTFLLFTPVFLYELLKFSHRIAGPLYRCRQVMQEMADGKPVPPFTPRKRDLMQELFQTFNALIQQWNARVGTQQDPGCNGAENGNGHGPRQEPTTAGPAQLQP